MGKKVRTGIIVFVLMAGPSLAAIPKITFSLKGGLFSPSSSTYNDQTLPSINRQINDIAAHAASYGFSTKSDELDKLKAALVFGAEAEVSIYARISFALGAEFWKGSPSAFIEASGKLGGTTYSISQKYDVAASLMPFLGTARYNFSFAPWRAYLGAGAGYYLGKFKFTMNLDIKENGASQESDRYEEVDKGQALVPHINAGLSYHLFKNISIAADIRYLFGKIKSFKVKESTDSKLVGQEVTFVDDQGNEKPFVWELSGINIGIFLRISF